MAFNFASAKAQLRRVVHDTLGVAAFYKDASMSAPAPIVARWHNKIDRFGDPENDGNAEVVQGVDRIVLFPLDTPLINFKKGGVVTFPEYGNAFALDVREPSTGPLQVVWLAMEKKP